MLQLKAKLNTYTFIKTHLSHFMANKILLVRVNTKVSDQLEMPHAVGSILFFTYHFIKIKSKFVP